MQSVNIQTLTTEIKEIVECIDSIDESYYFEAAYQNENGNLVPTGRNKTNESNYTANLLSCIKQSYESLNFGTDFRIETEPVKKLILQTDRYNNYSAFVLESDSESYNKFIRKPDIIIHKDPSSNNRQDQLLVAEVKIKLKLSQKLFNIDLFKLNVMFEQLNFQYAAFIITNTSIENVKKMYNEYINNGGYQCNNSSFYIIVKPAFNEGIAVFSLTS